MSRERIKREAKRLQKLLPVFLEENKPPFPLSACQELAAQSAGYQNFHAVPAADASRSEDEDMRKDAEAFLLQLDVSFASAISRGPQQWDDVNWDAWLSLVELHDETIMRNDIFAYPALVSNVAARLHVNPMDLDAMLIAVNQHEFDSFADAEQLVAQAMDHAIKCSSAFDAIDADDEDKLEEILDVVSPSTSISMLAAYLMMGAIEKENMERGANACRMSLASDNDGDPFVIADAGVCCALELGDLDLASSVVASILHTDSISLDDLTAWAAEEAEGGRAPTESPSAMVALLMYLERPRLPFPSNLYVQAALVHDQLQNDPLNRGFSDVVSKPVVGDGGISPEFVNVKANMALAAARYVAKRPVLGEQLAKRVAGRPKLH